MAQEQCGLVVIGFAEALSAPEVAWSLVDAGYRVVAFAREGKSALRCSRHVDVVEIAAPERSAIASHQALEALLQSYEHVAERIVLLPLDDVALWLCSRLDRRPNWIMAGAVGKCADLAIDKSKQIELARQCGLNPPDTLFVDRPRDLLEVATAYPVIVRPTDAVTISENRVTKGKNWICSNEKDLLRIASECGEHPRLMIQPFIQGRGVGVFGLATPQGVVAWSGHRRLRMMNPHGSGSSACVSQTVPSRLKAPINSFLQSCGWRGMFMIELLQTPDDQLWFVEFNGRAWGSMALARRQKLEYPAWTVQMANNLDWLPDANLDIEEELECRNLGREIMHLLFVLRGPQSRALKNWPSFWNTLVEMLRPTRRVHFYNWRTDDWSVFICDAWRTISNHIFKRFG